MTRSTVSPTQAESPRIAELRASEPEPLRGTCPASPQDRTAPKAGSRVRLGLADEASALNPGHDTALASDETVLGTAVVAIPVSIPLERTA